MTDSERDPDPAPEDEAPAAADGPLTQEEVEGDPAYDPQDDELKRVKGG